jgi:hypothetical protein
LLDEIKIEKVVSVRNHQNVFATKCHLSSAQGAFSFSLLIDWTQAMNLKMTEITSSNRNNGMLVNHSQQCVTSLSGEHLQYVPFARPRLSSHYAAVLKDCLQADSFGNNNRTAKTITEQVKVLAAHKCSTTLS